MKRSILILLLFASFSTGVGAQNVIWTGEVNSLWSEPSNWDPGLPGPGDMVIIPENSTVLADIVITVRQLQNSGQLTLDDEVNLLIDANQMVEFGLVNNQGSIFNHGTITIANTLGHGLQNINLSVIQNFGQIKMDNIRGNAIHNVQSELQNLDDMASSINISNSIGFGMYNEGGDILNYGEIAIGEQALTMGIQQDGILNIQGGSFVNFGEVVVDNTFVNGIRNEDINSAFENHGSVHITMRTNPESDGLSNDGVALMTSHLGSTLTILRGDRYQEGAEYPFNVRGDLTITQLATSEPLAQGVYFDIFIDIQNVGAGIVDSCEVQIILDNEQIATVDFPSIEPDEVFQIFLAQGVETGGKHFLQAEVIPKNSLQDADYSNNEAEMNIYVEGDSDPFISLEFEEPETPDDIIPGTSVQVRSLVQNAGYSTMEDFDITYYIDGEIQLVEHLDLLDPDNNITYEFNWLNVASGEHIITAEAKSSSDPTLVYTTSWIKIVKNATILYTIKEKDTWVSLGPKILTNGDVGRIDCMAIHPTDSSIMYVGATLGGLWKTTNGGQSWKPLTDKLPSMRIGAIALDPKNPEIIYIGTGSSIAQFGGGTGIYKSLDGGINWCQFMWKFKGPGNVPIQINGVRQIVIEYKAFPNYPLPPDKDFAIFIGTDKGIIRHYSSDSSAISTSYQEWDRILEGEIIEMHFTPLIIGEVYASIYKKGLFKTGNAYGTTVNMSDWTNLNPHFNLVDSSRQIIRMDIFPTSTSTLVAGINFPDNSFERTLKLFKSIDGGLSWSFIKYGHWEDRNYIDFIRFEPFNQNAVYYGGIKLYKDDLTSTGSTSFKRVTGIHDDQKAILFDPHQNFRFYFGLSDGGIYKCERKGFNGETCQNLNNDLRVTMFFDFDLSQTNQDLIIGGTQDNGTVLFSGSPIWKQIRGGDGKYSLIGSQDNKVFYSQYQFTNESQIGTNCLTSSCGWKNIASMFPKKTSTRLFKVTGDPTGQSIFIIFDYSLFYTSNAGMTWDTIAITNENMTWITTHPVSHDWYVGTQHGRVFCSNNGGNSWDTIYANSSNTLGEIEQMVFSIANPDILYMTSRNPKTVRLVNNTGTWNLQNISKGLPMNPRCIAGDGFNESIAYVGTEKGIYKWDELAGFWTSYNKGFPLTKVTDVQVNPISKELLAATWGRGAWTVVTGDE